MVCEILEIKCADFGPLSCPEAKLFVVQGGGEAGVEKMKLCWRNFYKLQKGAESRSWDCRSDGTTAPEGGERKLAELRR